jgi:phage shock protein C
MSVNDRLYRSVDDRVLAGVCAGLADRLDLDPALVRIGYAILALVTGIFPLLVLYVVMVVVVPEGPTWTGVRPVGPQPAGTGGPSMGWPAASASGDAGTPPDAAAPVAGMASDPAAPTGATPAQAMPTAPGAMPGWIPPGVPGGWDSGGWRDQRSADRVARHAERAARRAERRSDPIPAIIAGLFLVALGAFFLLRNAFDIDWAVVWPVAVIAFGVVVLIAAVRPRSG